MIAAPLLLALAAASSATDEEIIDDPLSQAPPSKPADEAKARVTKGEVALHVDAWARLSVDTRWSRDEVAPALGEDVARARLRTTLGVTGGTPATIRFALEARLELSARAKDRLERGAWTYEALPTAAWVDVPLGSQVRVRVGEQVVSWGRMDLSSAADILDRRDLREGPSHEPAAMRLPTPTARLDARLGDAFDLRVAWSVVPPPHRYDLVGTSWSILGPAVLTAPGLRETLDKIARSTDASTFARAQDALARASSPEARLDGGDLAARATMHRGGLDVALTYGFARSKLPILEVAPVLRDAEATSPVALGAGILKALDDGVPLLLAQFPRYHQVALDVEGTAGPFTISWELGYSPRRTLYASSPDAFPRAVDSGLLQAGLRAQWSHGEDAVVSVEVDAFEATSSARYLVVGTQRTIVALLATGRWVVGAHVFVEGAVLATTSGPSLALLPRVGWEAGEAWTIGFAGAFFPRLRDAREGAPLTLADVQAGRDLGELFVRFRR